MNFSGYPNWPPIWVSARGKPYLNGEIGILQPLSFNEVAPDKLFLAISFNEERYMGCLAFNDAAFCRYIHQFLQRHIGKSTKEIGDLDLSETL